MSNKTKFFTSLLFACLLLIMFKANAMAADALTGTLSLSYSAQSGKLTALYSGENSLSPSAVFSWYKDGSVVSTSSKGYTPTAAGSYYVTLVDTGTYTGMLTSPGIDLYKASGNNVSFDNVNGLYEAGDTVNCFATLGTNQIVKNWATNMKGIPIPATGTNVSFRMPNNNITVIPTIATQYSISVNGGTASSYMACQGDKVTLTASNITGKKFLKWSINSGSIVNEEETTTIFTMPAGNVTITANFEMLEENPAAKDTSVTTTATPGDPVTGMGDSIGVSNASVIAYKVLDSNGYSVKVSRHEQGPGCDAAFRSVQGSDYLVLDYMNITVNDSFLQHTDKPVRLCVVIPKDLQKKGRIFRMLCVSANGEVFSYNDEDTDDTTITFTTDRFYAYAMAFNDPAEKPAEEAAPADNGSQPATSTAPSSASATSTTATSQSSSAKKASSSKTASPAKTASESSTGNMAPAAKTSSKIQSDKTNAIINSNGKKVPIHSL